MTHLSMMIEKTYPWIKKIPQGSHGHGKYQKKLWKVVSDFVRIRDWYEWDGECISCNKKIPHWSEGDAGHYRAFSVCRGYSKFDVSNIFLQCSYDNNSDDHKIGETFAFKISERCGQKHLDYLDNDFMIREVEKLEDDKIVYMTWQLLQKMKELPEQPDYFNKLEI